MSRGVSGQPVWPVKMSGRPNGVAGQTLLQFKGSGRSNGEAGLRSCIAKHKVT